MVNSSDLMGSLFLHCLFLLTALLFPNRFVILSLKTVFVFDNILGHFIWDFTVGKSTYIGVTNIERAIIYITDQCINSPNPSTCHLDAIIIYIQFYKWTLNEKS